MVKYTHAPFHYWPTYDDPPPFPIAGNLPLKTLVARQLWPTNKKLMLLSSIKYV